MTDAISILFLTASQINRKACRFFFLSEMKKNNEKIFEIEIKSKAKNEIT